VSLSLRDAADRTVHHEILPLLVQLEHGPSSRRAVGIVEWTTEFLGGNAGVILATARAVIEAVHADVEALHARHVSALLEREGHVAGMAEPQQLAMQAGLFDRRTVRHLESRRAAAERLAGDREDRERAVAHDLRLRCDARILAIRS